MFSFQLSLPSLTSHQNAAVCMSDWIGGLIPPCHLETYSQPICIGRMRRFLIYNRRSRANRNSLRSLLGNCPAAYWQQLTMTYLEATGVIDIRTRIQVKQLEIYLKLLTIENVLHITSASVPMCSIQAFNINENKQRNERELAV